MKLITNTSLVTKCTESFLSGSICKSTNFDWKLVITSSEFRKRYYFGYGKYFSKPNVCVYNL